MVFRAFSFFAFIFLFHSVRAADTNPPPRLTVELRDGSCVIGESIKKDIEFRSALLGEIKLSVKDVRTIECVTTNTAKVITVNNDLLTLTLLGSEIPVKTSFGKVELKAESIRKLTVTFYGKQGSERTGLVALWSGEGDGKDSVGGHDAQISGGVSYTPAKIGSGFYFNGQPNSVIVSSTAGLNFGPGQDFSITAWIKVPSQMAYPESDFAPYSYGGKTRTPYLRDGIMSIVDKRDTPNNSQCRGYELILWNGRLHLRLSDSLAGIGEGYGPAGPDLRDGKFHYVAATVIRNMPDGGKLYVDGKEVLAFDPTRVSGDLSNNQPLHIGNHSDPSYQCFFNGIIDELAIYNRALSPEEVREDSQSGNW